jgi:transposase-like protein
VRERAVRTVLDHEDDYDLQWVAIVSISEKFGMTAETFRNWVRRAEVGTVEHVGAASSTVLGIALSSAGPAVGVALTRHALAGEGRVRAVIGS